MEFGGGLLIRLTVEGLFFGCALGGGGRVGDEASQLGLDLGSEDAALGEQRDGRPILLGVESGAGSSCRVLVDWALGLFPLLVACHLWHAPFGLASQRVSR
jgi:hypothetical protein